MLRHISIVSSEGGADSHDEEEDEDEDVRSHGTKMCRVKTMVLGRCKQKATDSAETNLGNSVTIQACEALTHRTREFYADLINTPTPNPPKARANRLMSLAMPEYTGPTQKEDPRFADLKVYSSAEKKQILRELSMANAEEVDALPDVCPGEINSEGAMSPSTGGIKIVRAYYRMCGSCGETKPVGNFFEDFLCLDCQKKKILNM